MSGSAAPISFTITAIDQTAKTIDAVTARMNAFGKRTEASFSRVMAPVNSLKAAVQTFGDVSGLNRVGAAFGGIARAGNEAYSKIGQVIPLLGIIGSAATVAGITRMVTAWSDLGSKVEFASQRMGMAAGGLAGLQGAARLAGSSADVLTGGLQSLGQTMYDAIGGRNPEAIVMFRTLGIAFQDASGHARSVTEVLPEVADKIKAIRDPFAQAQVATALFGGAAKGLLPFLRLGSQGIRDYVDAARRYGAISDAGAAAANRLREAQARVSLAVEGLGNRISERLEPVLTPMLTHFAEWLATSTQVAHGVEWLGQKVDDLGQYLSKIDWASVQQTWEGWGKTIATVVETLGGPTRVIEGLMALMVGSFAIKVIMPFLTLGTTIAGATLKLSALTAGMARMQGVGLAGLAGKFGGLLGGAGLGVAAWEGLNLAQDATQPSGDGLANLLHNMMFDMNPLHWTQGYHPGEAAAPGAGRGPQGQIGAPGSAPPLADGNAALREKQAFDYFVSQGKSPQAAAGIVAGLETESPGLNHRLSGDGGQAFGLAQLHPDRQAHFAQIFGHDIRAATFAENLMFKNMELSGTGGDPGSARAGQLMSAHGVTPGEAGAIDSLYAERPGDSAGEARRRRALAERVYSRQIELMTPAPSGPPMSLQNEGSNANGGSNVQSTVRVEFGGKLPTGMNMQVDNPHKVDVGGPLVERPMLLGANP